MILFDNKIKRIIFVSLISSVFLSFILDPQLFPDSQGYIDYHSLRSFGYPLFINLLQKNLFLVVLVQLFLAHISSVFFILELKKKFKLNNLSSLLIFLILIVISLKISLSILTGSLAFSLYLFSLIFLIKFLDKMDFKNFIISFFFIFLAVCIRSQIIFAMLNLLTISIYLYPQKKRFLFLLIPLISIILVIPKEINRFSNKTVNQINIPIVDQWNQLLVFPIYSSGIQISQFIENKEFKNLFTRIYNCMKEKKITKNIAIKNGQNWTEILDNNYFPAKNCSNTQIDYLYKNYSLEEKEEIGKKLYFKVIYASWKLNKVQILKDYFMKASKSFKNQYYALIFILFTFFLNLQLLLKFNKKLLFLNILCITHLSNVFLISLVAPMLVRYTFYTELILILALISLVINYFHVRKS